MRELIDLFLQLGRDSWLSENRPDLAHRSSGADLRDVAERYAAAGFRLVKAGVLPFPSAADADYAEANAEVEREANAASARPDTAALLPIYAVVPGSPGSTAQLRARLASGAPCLGVKLWPYMGRFSVDALLRDGELLELVRRHHLLVSIHVGTGREIRSREAFALVTADPLSVMQVVARLPDVTFHLGHLLRLSQAALEQAAGMDNVFLDSSGLSTLGRWREEGRDVMPAEDAGPLADMSPAAILSELCDARGLSDKIVFGSNWPFCTWWKSQPVDEVELVTHACRSDAVQRRILLDNAQRLLSRLGAR